MNGVQQQQQRFEAAWATLQARDDTVRFRARDTLRVPCHCTAARVLADSTLPPFYAEPGRPAEIDVRGKLGEGGMGVVHLATQTALGRDVAVKRLRPETVSPEAAGALLQEAWITGALEHPHVVPIHALGRDAQGHPMLVMKRIEGVSWQAALDGRAELPGWCRHADDPDLLRANVEILMRVCSAVHFAHSRGIIHCDLKPDNVMLGAYGEVYVLDWGIAVSLRDDGSGRFPLAKDVHQAVGTPACMSPEQAAGEGERFSPATDVYGLGAILHRLVTGQMRHTGDDLRAVLYDAWLSEPFDYPVATVCASMAELCNRAMARDPAERFPDAEALRQALALYLERRASLQLAEEAEDKLIALEQRLNEDASFEATQLDEQERHGLHELFGQCRFGFQQALRTWPENPVARGGLQRALRQMAEHELRAGALDAAGELIGQLDPPAPELLERLRDLRESRKLRDAELRRLRELQREGDLTIGSRARSVVAFCCALAVVAVPLPMAVLERLGVYQPSERPSFLFAIPFFATVLLIVFFARRRLLRNRVNRGIVGSLLLIILGRIGHRVLALQFAMTVKQMMVLDLSVMFMATGVLALTVDRRIGVAAAVYLLAFYAGVLATGWAMVLISLANVVALTVIGLVWLRGRGEGEGRPQAAKEGV